MTPSMVRKGSPVRVRQRALREDPASAGSFSLTGASSRDVRGWHRVSYRVSYGPFKSISAPFLGPFRPDWAGQLGARCGKGSPAAPCTGMDHLQLTLDAPRDEEFLTIAEAAARVRCCERTI